MLVLVNRSVKMCLKGVEKRAEAGFHNAPQYSNKDGRNVEFKNVIRDASCVVFDASDATRDTPYTT